MLLVNAEFYLVLNPVVHLDTNGLQDVNIRTHYFMSNGRIRNMKFPLWWNLTLRFLVRTSMLCDGRVSAHN